MAPTPAKMVNITTAYAQKDRVEQKLAELSIIGFSFSNVRGHGSHGHLLDASNISFTIITTAELADKLLHWVEHELIAHHPGIAYATDVMAVSHTLPPHRI